MHVVASSLLKATVLLVDISTKKILLFLPTLVSRFCKLCTVLYALHVWMKIKILLTYFSLKLSYKTREGPIRLFQTPLLVFGHLQGEAEDAYGQHF